VMNDCIEREAVWNAMNEIGGCGADADSWADGWDKAINAAIRIVERLPSIAAVPARHGHWLHKQAFECSECGYGFEPEGYVHFFNYCPCCGAKMDGGVKENA
ncbi:MAG: hypothetical protein ACI4RH_09220, partial [Huintestinicola sp.]